MRYFFEISYDGTNYHGWQKQPNSKTIQETIETCFSTILKQKIDIVGAGRTDAGVHARKMIAHFDYGFHFFQVILQLVIFLRSIKMLTLDLVQYQDLMSILFPLKKIHYYLIEFIIFPKNWILIN